jgi:hypothetical protein
LYLGGEPDVERAYDQLAGATVAETDVPLRRAVQGIAQSAQAADTGIVTLACNE